MRNLIAFGLLIGLASTMQAGPFSFLRRGNGGNYYANTGPVRGAAVDLSSAAKAAAYMASLGRIGHFGGNPYAAEGVGSGGSPDQAIRNCCFYGRRPIADQGVAQCANGQWFACCRYN